MTLGLIGFCNFEFGIKGQGQGHKRFLRLHVPNYFSFTDQLRSKSFGPSPGLVVWVSSGSRSIPGLPPFRNAGQVRHGSFPSSNVSRLMKDSSIQQKIGCHRNVPDQPTFGHCSVPPPIVNRPADSCVSLSTPPLSPTHGTLCVRRPCVLRGHVGC